MTAVKVADGLFWVGAVDWNVRSFHGHTYNTQRGTTYNAYLVMDPEGKVALVDTVHEPFANEMIENIRELVPLGKIDYIVMNHVERDHSGALPAIHKLCPKAQVLGTEKCKEGLYKNYYGDWEFKVVKSGDKLSLGKKTLTFIEAPMIHWPDSMFTYMVEDQILLPNDAFGQHYATSERFDDEVDQGFLMDEAAKYYANIIWPLSQIVLRKIEEVQKAGVPIKMIAPSHGIIWRKDPMKIVNQYISWAKNETKKKVVIVYETMWESTAKMAKQIADGLIDEGGIDVKLYDINSADRTEVIKEMLDAKGYLIGSSTHGNDMLPNIEGFLGLKILKPKNRIGAAFGSYGWAGGAVMRMEGMLKETGIELSQPPISVRFVPDENESKLCYEFGKSFAQKI